MLYLPANHNLLSKKYPKALNIQQFYLYLKLNLYRKRYSEINIKKEMSGNKIKYEVN